MKKVTVVGHKVHTSIGKLVKGDNAELPNAEVETLMRVRPDALKVLGDVSQRLHRTNETRQKEIRHGEDFGKDRL